MKLLLTSPSQDHDSDADGSLSITSNIHKRIEGKIDISAKANSHSSHSQSQDVDYLIDATENEGQPELNGNYRDANELSKGAKMTLNICNG